MSVVNCRVANIRPTYSNLQEWMADEQNVYIGRAGVVFIHGQRFPPRASPFANPFKINESNTREMVLEKYRTYIVARLKEDTSLCEELYKLKGKRLGCWCFPEPCHGDILLELLNCS